MKYKLTPEHRTQLKLWADKWIKNALSTKPTTETERARIRRAIRGLYKAADLTPPPSSRIIFVPSPMVARFAAGYAAWIWYCRKNGITKAITDDTTDDATNAATNATTRDAISATTDAATHAATNAATCAATRAATDAATYAATRATTSAATYAATNAATNAATDAAILDAITIDATFDATRDATRDATFDATRDATFDATLNATDAATRDATDAATSDATNATTNNAINAATRAVTNNAINAATDAATNAATDAATYDATNAATNAATRAATDAATLDAIDAVTRNVIKAWYTGHQGCIDAARLIAEQLGDQKHIAPLLECANKIYWAYNGGNQWSGWVAYLSFFRHVAKLSLDYSKWSHYEEAAKAGPRFMHEEFCIISERPLFIKMDDENQPHCEDGPFCQWRDGFSLYAIHGVYTPQWVVENPSSITIDSIKREQNAEVRRIMRERYGDTRYFADTQATILDVDHQLIDRLVPNGPAIIRMLVRDDEDALYLVASDGSTDRIYVMRVPPGTLTCRQAHEALTGKKESLCIGRS